MSFTLVEAAAGLVALAAGSMAALFLIARGRERRGHREDRKAPPEGREAVAVPEPKPTDDGFELLSPAGLRGLNASFERIAGVDEVVGELRELVDFLKNPEVYERMGAHMPRGYLLYGKTGTGKTMLARALASECGTYFLHASGSSFVHKYVGAGADKVRKFFRMAREHTPIVVFIDEIDALGRRRASGESSQEYDHCLNQFLVEMDGFRKDDRVVVMAATNNQQILDEALLRPGRFDRQIWMPVPDVRGREAIFRIHTENKPLDPSVDIVDLARHTYGMTGAEIEKICNEAAIMAVRRRGTSITQEDFLEGIDRALAGVRHSRELSAKTRRMVAYHEVGHAVNAYVSGAEEMNKITIVPRGMALGYVHSSKESDDPLSTEEEMRKRIQMAMGGRAAEEIFFGTKTSGAAMDLKQATQIAGSMVYQFGIGERLSTEERATPERSRDVDAILDAALEAAKETLLAYRGAVDALVGELLEKETLSRDEFAAVFEAHRAALPAEWPDARQKCRDNP